MCRRNWGGAVVGGAAGSVAAFTVKGVVSRVSWMEKKSRILVFYYN